MPGDTVDGELDDLADLDDAGRVEVLRAADPRGLASAYGAYADRLFGFCLTMLGDRAAAEDAVHDSFVVAGRRAHHLRGAVRGREAVRRAGGDAETAGPRWW
jgi:DNA-directed RNA polymerase specialized sigma24 family protein